MDALIYEIAVISNDISDGLSVPGTRQAGYMAAVMTQLNLALPPPREAGN